ncbi:MAG: ribonuclease III [Dehalococcoidia bacterium]|nr:ribonuclease III [Dehalococcoidia bacterium]
MNFAPHQVSPPEQDISSCQERLGLEFKNPRLLEQALVHGSYINETQGTQVQSNERMEFLGDAVVGLVVGEELYTRLPYELEGTLTAMRAGLVRRETLAKAGRRLGLGEYLRLGKGEEASGGRDKDRNLADAFEAVTGAVYLDQGYPKATAFVLRHLQPYIDTALQTGTAPNYKALLQESLQAGDHPLPIYRVVSAVGPDHDKHFTASVSVDGETMGHGSGHTKKLAETAAAREAWTLLRSREV